MAVKKDIKSKVKPTPKEESVVEETQEEVLETTEQRVDASTKSNESGSELKKPSKKVCLFCSKKTSPEYWDTATLKRFVSDRGRIVPRSRSGVCSKHQRGLAKNIKYARHLSLLPFSVGV